ncbi:Co2+/Mg2+ efflux protein ApaG [Kordiimonas aquimaris]|uniref:Co2+/Mg2+ efflux protein ApaG n=1 Tax=Kordiimonas aquimaris TaxID=707591 RepID=UPI0021CE7F65|nr:Co2+/Mg2+ efflux protein ApaG [Kordiimonas aquimaris]
MEDLLSDVMTFEAVTDGIRVAVQSYFLDDQSEPSENQYVWAYRIKIMNESEKSVQLMARQWVIINGEGLTKEVSGEGVIGEQPIILPGQHYVYTSGTPLTTATGFMRGQYEMQDENGDHFFIEIPNFSLDSPYYALNVN